MALNFLLEKTHRNLLLSEIGCASIKSDHDSVKNFFNQNNVKKVKASQDKNVIIQKLEVRLETYMPPPTPNIKTSEEKKEEAK